MDIRDDVLLREAARLAGKSPRTILRWIQSGQVAGFKRGERWYVNLVEVLRTAGKPETLMTLSHIQQLLSEHESRIRALEAEIRALKDPTALEPLSRNQMAIWLAEHGVNQNTANHWSWLDLKDKRHALEQVQEHLDANRQRSKGSHLHECDDPQCVCHTLLNETN